MKKNMKLKVTALVAMLFMAIAVTFLSFSHADEEIQDDSLLMADASTAVDVGSKTNIDYIIMNSNSTDPEVDPHYNIVEIYSDKASGLEGFAKNLDFENYVINDYSTLGEAMKRGMVNYTSYQTKEIKNDSSDILKEISNADLIYVNQGSSAFSKTNDICENLYDILHTYAVGEYKPLIINSEKKSSGNESSTTTQETMGTLATDVFYRGMYYYTFAWDTSKQSLSDFLTHNNGSMYLGINGKTQEAKKKWTTLISEERDTDGKIKKDAEGNTKVLDTKKMAKFLVLSGDGTAAKDMRSQLLPSTLVEYDITGYRASDSEDDYTLPTGSTSKIYRTVNEDGLRTIVVDSIYNAKYTTPDLIQVDEAKLTDIGDSTFDLSKYDFILIDETAIGNISTDIYNKLSGAMYGSVSIVYPSSLETSTAISSNTVTDTQAYNYLELYYMVATTENMSRYDNVMVTSEKELNTIMSGGKTGAGAIASLINKSTYRGIGGKGSSSNMYTVLEIQPCYPIDEVVAEKNGKYYSVPANLLNDVDIDTLPVGEDGIISVEYYRWELSKKKIAEAVGIDANKVQIVHMSTEELAASKEPILGTYDLVYIGGNRSALKSDVTQWLGFKGIQGAGSMKDANLTDEMFRSLPFYTMYTHNGDMVWVYTKQLGESGGDVKSGSPAGDVKINGSYKNSFSLLNGNDISYDRLVELEKYVSKGMPVIIENEAYTAYTEVKKAGYKQNSIDPDCNMFKFLAYCDNEDYKDSVLWGVNNSSLKKNADFNPASFNKTDSSGVYDLVKKSSRRPKLTVTAMPLIYNYYDKSTRLSTGNLNFAFDVDGLTADEEGNKSYSVEFLIDDDGDNIFETLQASGTDVTTLECKLDSKYFGPVSWMLRVTDNNTELTAYTKGISYIVNSSGKAQTVDVLQIMPGEEVESKDWSGKVTKTASKGETAQGANALYFCPMCQQAYEKLEYNPIGNSGYRERVRYGGNYDESAHAETTNTQSPYLGIHEHVFGIPKYDSNLTIDGENGSSFTGCDDWSTNLADDVSDLYDINIDIMLRSEFEKWSRDIEEIYDLSGMTEDEKDQKIAAFDATMDASNPKYDEWKTIATKDEKVKYIISDGYKDDATTEYNLYVQAKALTDVAEVSLNEALDEAIKNKPRNFSKDFEDVKKSKRYSDIFSAIADNSTEQFRYVWPYDDGLKKLANAYFEYRDLKDEEIKHHENYKDLMRKASYDNWLLERYDMVIIGPSDDFAGDDIQDPQALAYLVDYVDRKGSILLFHDTLTPTRDSGSYTLTATMRGYFGMDRNRGLTQSKLASESTYYVPYDSSDKKRYFMTNLSWKDKDDNTRYASWTDDINSITAPADNKPYKFSPNRYLTNVVYTDSFLLSHNDFGNVSDSDNYNAPYKYAGNYWAVASNYFRDASPSQYLNLKKENKYGTDKASQNNKGIVTQYPFTLSDELNISPTHAQAYALELDNSKMNVWYSLAGGNNGPAGTRKFSASSLYAASRNDGMDSYFIYSFGNVNYCGAGHSKITGIYKDNNDERRLYINIIVNSVKNSVNMPGIIVYDYETSNETKKDGENYLLEVKNVDDWPVFSFSATVDTSVAGNKISRVRIYYDLDYDKVEKADDNEVFNKDEFINNTDHVLIADLTEDKNGKSLVSGQIYDVGKDIGAALQLKPEYFEAYNGEYTYIVIEVTDAKNNPSYQRIKIKLLPYLFEMTQNNINHVIDMIDKI